MSSVAAVRRLLPLALVVAVALPAIACAATAPAPEGRTFDYRHTEGDQAVYDHKASAKVKVREVGGSEQLDATMLVQMRCRVEFLGETASGDQGARGDILSGTFVGNLGGEEEEEELPESSVKYLLSPRGKIKDTELLSGEAPRVDLMGAIVSFSPDAAFLCGGAAEFPDKPLKKGDRWQGSEKIPDYETGGKGTISYTSKLLGEEKLRGALCQKIKTQRTVSFTTTVEEEESGALVKVTLKYVGDFTWLYDPERKLVMYSEGKDRLNVSAKAALEGESFAFTNTGDITYRSVLVEYNGVPVAAK